MGVHGIFVRMRICLITVVFPESPGPRRRTWAGSSEHTVPPNKHTRDTVEVTNLSLGIYFTFCLSIAVVSKV